MIMWKFLLKNWQYVLIAILVGAVYASSKIAINNRQKYKREKNNVEVLMSEIEHSRTKAGEDVATIGELQLTVEEFKKLRADDAKLIKELKIKASEVKEVVKTVVQTNIEYRDTLVYVSPNQFTWDKKTDWWWVNQKINFSVSPPTVDFKMGNKDSLTHVLYKVPKFKFLWWHLGTKGYKIKVVNHNPNSEITYSEWINVSKESKKRKRD